MDKRIGKRDIILLVIIFAVVMAVFVGYKLTHREAGAYVEITVDGETYGVYPLNEEKEIPIEINGTITNTLVISNGEADMTDADCPDKLCVNMKAISANGETIVCLPNKVVAEVTDENNESDLDAIVK